jgi:hypothetical protein
MRLYSAHVSVAHALPEGEPLGREGLAILALRKLYRQPYFFRRCTVMTP